MTVTEFNTKFNNLESLLFGFAMKLTKNRDRSRDLMQETTLRAFKNKDRFREGTNFKAWITTIMRNSFINEYRKQRTRNKAEQPVEDILHLANDAVVGEKATSSIMMQELTGIVSQLSDTYRIPFTMFYNGYHYNEIAESMNLPIGTIKSRIFFARKQLKAAVTDKYGDNVMELAS